MFVSRNHWVFQGFATVTLPLATRLRLITSWLVSQCHAAPTAHPSSTGATGKTFLRPPSRCSRHSFSRLLLCPGLCSQISRWIPESSFPLAYTSTSTHLFDNPPPAPGTSPLFLLLLPPSSSPREPLARVRQIVFVPLKPRWCQASV